MKSIRQIVIAVILFVQFSNAQAQKIGATKDNLGIVIRPSSSYLFPGQDLEISIFQEGDSKYPMTRVTIGGMEIPFYKKGIAIFKTSTGAPGGYTIPVEVFYKDDKGLTKRKSFPVEYTVGMPIASIGLDRMNMLYIGIDNPITVATSLGGDDKLLTSIRGGGGSLSKVGNGKLKVRVTKPTDDCVISLQVDDKTVGHFQYRVRHLPTPIGTVGGRVSGDTVEAATLKNQAGVSVYLKDFPIELRYTVKRYTLFIQDEKGVVKSANCNNAEFSLEAKKLMADYLGLGKYVTIGNLFVQGPDGRELQLLPVLYVIK